EGEFTRKPGLMLIEPGALASSPCEWNLTSSDWDHKGERQRGMVEGTTVQLHSFDFLEAPECLQVTVGH
ncbi:MAG TPA: hypothetical protein VM715_01635, partial [Candidatus Acidoferrum sp.]|nr:hypothetical protein [Candidatus Acidoferrum sp.]